MSCCCCECVEERENRDFSEAIRKRKQELDPEAWKSYSGKPKQFKQSMERRRIASAQLATKQIQEEHGL